MRPVAILNVVAAALLAGVIGSRSTQATVSRGHARRRRAGADARRRTPPAGYVGAEACATCHTGYDASIRSSRHGQAQDPRTPAAAQGCETCHGPGEAHASDPEKVKPVQFDRLPAREVDRQLRDVPQPGTACAVEGQPARSAQRLVRDLPQRPPAEVGQGAAEDVDQQKQCMSCHRDKVAKLRSLRPHAGARGQDGVLVLPQPARLDQRPAAADGQLDQRSCSSCHAEKRGPYLFEHAGISGDSCATCHDPHGSNNDRMLVAKLPFLCQRCHNHTRHPSTIYDNKVLQTSNRLYGRSCVTCHSAIHGSNHPAGSTFLRQ